jgi:hypothetical protein
MYVTEKDARDIADGIGVMETANRTHAVYAALFRLLYTEIVSNHFNRAFSDLLLTIM